MTIKNYWDLPKVKKTLKTDEAFILSLLSTCLGKEYRSETCSVEDYQLGKEAFSLFFKFHEQLDYADKCWASILDLCVMSLNEFVKVEDYEEVLKKILEVKYTFSIDLSLVEYIFFQTDCCTNGLLPLITQILEKNRMEGSFTNYMMYQSIYDMTDELKLAKQVADYFTYLEKFRTREQIMQSHLNDFIISSMGRLPDTYIDELLKLYPIDLNSVSFSDCARFQVTEKILEIANRRGIYYPLETVEKAIVDIYYTRSSYNTIKYIMEHYNLDIYEIEKRTKFFSRFLGSLLRYDINTEQLKSNIETIFPNSPIEWKKLASIHDGINEITERIISLVQTCCERPSGEELLYLRECFTPNIFDLNVMVRSLSNATPACSLTLYNLTMYSEDEKLSDHMDRMLNEQDFSHFTGIDFANYGPSDPRYLVAVYRFVHQ
ncbi:predicted protein [Naegleria gruberi]|uniref:Predicted protein n=1 Tax=Naegleria gruberi TaxID=5762 RepID=D2VY16_NAEGR|nr:uncharacterized protein NAEGRDRAFT_53152 [Naegleria gruberi]EFC38245.1 predicted protein [Naegleria gruberi]|eukprot:XP_002670989.1 predicted protein [Naegleria gruberi strain NEG-M]